MLSDASSGALLAITAADQDHDETNPDKRKYSSEQETQSAFRSAWGNHAPCYSGRSGRDPDRPVEGGVHRRRAQDRRDRPLVPQDVSQDFKIGRNLTGGGVDDPDQQLYENYGCGSPRNYTGYCNPELEELFERQSAEADEGKPAAASCRH